MQSLDYLAPRASDITVTDTTVTVFKRADNSAKATAVYVPAKTKAFIVRAGGTCSPGTTSNFTPTIQWGSSTTATSNTDLAALTARAYAATSGSWFIESYVHFDSVNSKLHGWKDGWSGSTVTIETHAVITDLTSITTVDNKPLVVNGLFSTANATNTATLDFFTLEVLAQAK